MSIVATWIPFEWLPELQLLIAADYGIFLLALTLLLLSWWGRKAVVMPLIGFVLAFCMLLLHHGLPDTIRQNDELGKESVRLISINVRQFGNDTTRVRQMVDRLNSLNPDIVVVQEFGLYYRWQDLNLVTKEFSAQLNKPHYQFAPHPDNIFGVACFSRFPILDSSVVFEMLSETNQAMEYSIKIGSDTLSLQAVHLMSYNFSAFDEAGYSLRHKLTERFEEAGKVASNGSDLIVGDFNSVPGDAIYRRLASAYFDALSGSFTPSYKPLPVRIDHAFYGDRILIQNAEYVGGFPTDHRAILLDFHLQP